MPSPLTLDPDYELFCNQQLQNPYPLFTRLRQEQPVHWCEPMKMWLVTRYDDVLAGLKETKRLVSSRDDMYTAPLTPANRELAQPLVKHIGLWMQNLNPPDHTRNRKLVSLVFTPRMLQNLVPRIEQIVDNLLDDVCVHGETDFYRSFCLPFPAKVICEMLGIPAEDQDQYHETLEQLFPFSGAAGPRLNDAVAPARQAMEELLVYFDRLIEQRRQDPQEDLISALAAAEVDADRLSRDELFALCVFLYNAGHETTVSLLVNGTLLLLEHPDQFEMLQTNLDTLLESTVDEILRYESPVPRAVRVPLEPYPFGTHVVPQGETIMMLIGAANRDPDIFPDPERFDITRTPNKHLGFGHGIHFCLGAPLARLEANIAFRAIAERLANMQLATDDVQWRSLAGLRSVAALPIRIP